MPSLLFNRVVGNVDHGVVNTGGEIPIAGRVVSAILSMLTIVTLSLLLTRRIAATSDWKKVPITRWLTFVVYVDSIVFIIAATILDRGFGLNSNYRICDASILLCLTCYLSTKAVIFLFLIEKVYIIQKVRTPRFKSPLYLFNFFGLLLPYCGIIVLNFVFRVAIFNDDGTCIIGMENISVMPLIIVDAGINLYLTLLFVIPLRKLYSYTVNTTSALRTITLRSFIGSCATLTSSVVNLTVLMLLKGEASWICLMLCNADVLFSVVVLHWVTSKDSSVRLTQGSSGATGTRNYNGSTLRSTTKAKFGDTISPRSAYGGRTVTTLISAVGPDPESDRDDSIELKRIRVQVEHTHTVEREDSTENIGDMGRTNNRSE